MPNLDRILQLAAQNKATGTTQSNSSKQAQIVVNNGAGRVDVPLGTDASKLTKTDVQQIVATGKVNPVQQPLPTAKANSQGVYVPTGAVPLSQRVKQSGGQASTPALPQRQDNPNVFERIGSIMDASAKRGQGNFETLWESVGNWAGDKLMDVPVVGDWLEEQLAKPENAYLRESKTPLPYKTTKEIAYETAERDIARAKEGLGKTGQAAVDVASTISDMGYNIAASAATGIPARAFNTASSAASAIEQAKADGSTDDEALAYGVLRGGLSYAIDKLSGGIPGFGKGFADDVIAKVSSKIAKNPAGANLVKRAFDVLGEGAEEALETAIDPLLQRLTYDENADFATGEDLLYSAVMGALASAVFNAPGAVADTVNAAKTALPRKNASANAQTQTEATPTANVQTEAEPTMDTQTEAEADADTEVGFMGPEVDAESDPSAEAKAHMDEMDAPPKEEVLHTKAWYEATYQAQKAGERLGVKVVLTKDLPSGVNGAYKNGVIYISENAQNPLKATFVHELTHHLEATNTYEELRNYVLNRDFSNVGGLDAYRAKIRNAYAKKGKTIDDAGADAEIVANFIEQKLFNNSKEIAQLANKHRSLVQVIRDWFTDLRVKFHGKPEEKELLRAQRLFEKALRETGAKGYRTSGDEQYGYEAPIDVQTYGPELAKQLENADALSKQTSGDADEVKLSIQFDEDYMLAAERKNAQTKRVALDILNQAHKQRRIIARLLSNPEIAEQLNLPADVIRSDIKGNTYIGNGSYSGSEENSTECIRTLAAEALMDAVAEKLGRPLTVEDTLVISQEYWKYTDKPECLYCYIAMDRKAKREYFGEYLKQRDGAIENLRAGMDFKTALEKFRDGRAPTGAMENRLRLFAKNMDKELITPADLASEDAMARAVERNPALKEQIDDAKEYAQKASWAKKKIAYNAYNNHILRWSDRKVRDLNRNYGLRMYSFSDFSPAFVLENMQMITDAAVRGLKMLAYTKETDFVKIFAPTGMNINISVFATEGEDGTIAQDGMQGAKWAEAQALRQQYPNVGCTFVATNDAQIEWALDQEWIDVVIPFHMVKTGAKVADYFGWKNYTQMASDMKTTEWKKGNAKSIMPPQHQNNKEMYLAACAENNLTPRFKDWIGHPNYMKLVNETRRSDANTPTVQPRFNLMAAVDSLKTLREQGGYGRPIGRDRENMLDIAEEIAGKIESPLNGQLSIDLGEDDPFRASTGRTADEINADIKSNVDQYSAMRENKQPGVREATYPHETAQGKTMHTAQTIGGSNLVDDRMELDVKEAILAGKFAYEVSGDKAALRDANKRIEDGNYDKLAEQAKGYFADGYRLKKEQVVFVERMIQEAAKKGDVDTAMSLITDLAAYGTEQGQNIQALSMIRRMTPEGKLMVLKRQVDKANKMTQVDRESKGEIKKTEQEIKAVKKDAFAGLEDIGVDESMDIETAQRVVDEAIADETAKAGQSGLPTAKKQQLQQKKQKLSEAEKKIRELEKATKNLKNPVTIPTETVEAMLKAKSPSEQNDLYNKALDEIASQIVSSLPDKVNAWRYLAMLGNPRTHVRNITGNATMLATNAAKNIVKRGFELIPGTKKTTVLKASKDAKAFAKEDFELNRDLITGGGKMNASDELRDRMKIFENKGLEALRKFNTNAMEAEDTFFMRHAYESALARYITANKKSKAFLESGSAAAESFLQKARDYAIKEAREVTFHDDSAVADWLSGITRSAKDDKLTVKAAKAMVEGVLPFKKTPINVAKRGIEYSPVSIATAINKFAKGDAEGAVNDLAKGTTGTIMMAVGLALAHFGMLRTRNEEKDEVLDTQENEQNYSLRIPNADGTVTSVSLDALMPAAMPLLVGVEVNKLLKEEDMSVMSVLESLTGIADPIVENSMLDGLNDMLTYVGYSDSAIGAIAADMGESYVEQFRPSILRQVQQSIDPTVRTTYTPKDSPIGKGVEAHLRSLANVTPVLPLAAEKLDDVTGSDRFSLQPKIDVWGNEVERADSFGARLVQNMVLPFNVKKVTSDPVNEELRRLYHVDSTYSVLPKAADKSFAYQNENYYAEPAEYTALAKEKGQTAHEYLETTIKDAGYKALPDAKKADVVSNLMKYANYKAKQDFFDGRGINYVTDTFNGVEKAVARGLTAEDYYIMKAQMDGGQTAEEKISYYMGMLTNEQKKFVARLPKDAASASWLERIALSNQGENAKITSAYDDILIGEKKEKVDYSDKASVYLSLIDGNANSKVGDKYYEYAKPAGVSVEDYMVAYYAQKDVTYPAKTKGAKAAAEAAAIDKALPNLSKKQREALYQAFK